MYQPSSYKGTALPTQRQRKEVVPSRPLLQEGGQDVDGGSSQSPVMLPESDGQARLEENTGSPRFAAISVPKISGADFEEILKDIDSEILEDHHDHLPVVTEIIQQLNKSAGHSNSVKQNTESQVVLGEGISKIIDKGEMGTGQTRERFQMGWVEEKDNNKGKKTAGKKVGLKNAQAQNKASGGPNRKPNDSPGPKKGSWTRILHKPKECMEIEAHGIEVGIKRKTEGPEGLQEERGDVEKKQKVDEETKQLSMLFATHLGAAEVAKQPRWAQ
nr:hypothetical protein CFP56_45418 [Quercus suber]